eukprot:Nk52_evm3s2103 gene=Nk52_evmTU3s2103
MIPLGKVKALFSSSGSGEEESLTTKYSSSFPATENVLVLKSEEENTHWTRYIFLSERCRYILARLINACLTFFPVAAMMLFYCLVGCFLLMACLLLYDAYLSLGGLSEVIRALVVIPMAPVMPAGMYVVQNANDVLEKESLQVPFVSVSTPFYMKANKEVKVEDVLFKPLRFVSENGTTMNTSSSRLECGEFDDRIEPALYSMPSYITYKFAKFFYQNESSFLDFVEFDIPQMPLLPTWGLNVGPLKSHPLTAILSDEESDELTKAFNLSSTDCSIGLSGVRRDGNSTLPGKKRSGEVDASSLDITLAESRVHSKEVQMEMFTLSLFAALMPYYENGRWVEKYRMWDTKLGFAAQLILLEEAEKPHLKKECDAAFTTHKSISEIATQLAMKEGNRHCTDFGVAEALCSDTEYLNEIHSMDLRSMLPLTGKINTKPMEDGKKNGRCLVISGNPLNTIKSYLAPIKKEDSSKLLKLPLNLLSLSDKQEICRRYVQTPIQNTVKDPFLGMNDEELKELSKDFSFFVHLFAKSGFAVLETFLIYTYKFFYIIYFYSIFSGKDISVSRARSMLMSLRTIGLFFFIRILELAANWVWGAYLSGILSTDIEQFVHVSFELAYFLLFLSLSFHTFLADEIPASHGMSEAQFRLVLQSICRNVGLYALLAMLLPIFLVSKTLLWSILWGALEYHLIFITIPTFVTVPSSISEAEIRSKQDSKMT